MCPPSNISRRRSHKALLRGSKLVLDLVFDAGARELVRFAVREPESCQKTTFSKENSSGQVPVLLQDTKSWISWETTSSSYENKLRAARKLCNKRGKTRVSCVTRFCLG